ncbi:hypothetical protein RND81_02G202000 [Saponaria officinalis]|uniref:ATP-dependent DNA helicase n=1 Tax=Saponaria officinalis TaxID=3572 RepID=A0AAW1MXK7_SAPOF
MMLRAGRCLQQYVVDMYVKLENTRLDFLRHNQETIRAELYQGLLDTIDTGEQCAANVGRRVILPATYIGGPRDMKRRYLNAMALVQRYGKPDFFITITCNAQWPEIQNELACGEEAQNRPDLVARVFRAKLLALKKMIVEQKIFGEVAAFVYVVEFQKRGLPHAHILLIMKPGNKMNCPDDFDKFVCAEIPPVTNTNLRRVVLRHMMHGPYGQLKPDCSCMKHGKSLGHCKYEYSKSFTSDTTKNDDGYPVYRRRQTGENVEIRGKTLNNSWVIPYNPYLMDLFDCHLNVEVCSTIQAVKYLYKYVYKGHDRISFNIPAEADVKLVDEIQEYQAGRWVSPVEAIWRIYGLVFVAPSEGERYFLKLLITHVVAPKSFEDLRTIDGCYCSSYQEAALKLKLIEDDNMVELSLDEAATVQMPSALRRLFATILIFCQPKDPTALWDKYYTSLSEDYSRKHLNDAYTTKVLTVRQLERHLEAMGKSLKTFGLAHLNEHQDVLLCQSHDILDALNAPIPEQCIMSRDSLNSEQQEAFNIIMKHVRENKPGAFFVDGPGGTGKTYLYNALYAELRLMGKIVLPTATSGIAAANIPSGRTTHSRFKLPIDLEISLSCAVPKQSSLAALIRATSLIIWDEASMARKESVEALDQLLRDLCNPDLIFGGKLIVFGGDFRQVLPVVQHKSIREVVKLSMVASAIWPHLTKFSLTINIRAKNDPGFCDFLLSLGNGELQTKESELVQLPKGIVQDTSEIGTDLIAADGNTAYPESDIRDIGTRTVIVYKGFDSMLTENCNIYPSEFINKLFPGGMSPYELILKKNCPVILLRNLLPSAGLCNGTRLICVQFTPNVIECVITNGHHSGEHVFIPRIKMRPSSSSNYPFQFQRNQFSLKLSFAMTINKSQGQTLDQVVVYLPRPCFSPGQLYIALLRAKEASKVTVVTASTDCDSSQRSVKNIVSFEVLKLADIVGIVLFVEEHSRKIMTANKRECNVREIMVIDHSTPQPLSISVWDELAEDDCNMLTPVPGQFKTVGLTALRVSNYKGFSMTTSSSTIIIHSPIGEKAEALSTWMTSHQTALTQLQSRIYHIKMPMLVIKTTKISALRSKKTKSTLQDEKHWLEVAIPNAELHKINAYMGCSKCAKRSSIPPGRTYTCSTCSKPDCTTTPKITFSCDISDGTGTLPMTIFTSTAEQLFKMSASDIYHMKHSDDDQAFTAVQELLRVITFKVQVGPAKSFSINNILQWEVMDIVLDGEDGKPYKNESIQTAAAPSQECKTMINSMLAHSVNDDSIAPTHVTQQVPTDASIVICSAQLNPPGNILQKMSQETTNPNIQTEENLKKKAKKDETDSPLTLYT